jgi:Heavy metal binding domain
MVARSAAAIGIAIAVLAAPWPAVGAQRAQVPPAAPAQAEGAVYMCPMHPDVRGAAGEKCPRCGMELVLASAADYQPYAMDFDVTPRAIHAGQPGTVRFLIRNPKDGSVVRRFEEVHERFFHLFIVSQDLDYFAHVHPTLRANGTLDLRVTLPRAGVYQMIGDFVPSGGAPQLQQRAVVTAGYAGPLNRVADLSDDLAEKVVDGTRVNIELSPLRAGREQLMTLELEDAATRKPVGDLEPYLGATGHLLAASADLSVVFHSHPVAGVSSTAGPAIVFQVLFPKAGRYRLWTQFQRHGRVSTVVFTVPVAANE